MELEKTKAEKEKVREELESVTKYRKELKAKGQDAPSKGEKRRFAPRGPFQGARDGPELREVEMRAEKLLREREEIEAEIKAKLEGLMSEAEATGGAR